MPQCNAVVPQKPHCEQHWPLHSAPPAAAPHALPPAGFDDGAAEGATEGATEAATEGTGVADADGNTPQSPYGDWQPAPQCKAVVPQNPYCEQHWPLQIAPPAVAPHGPPRGAINAAVEGVPAPKLGAEFQHKPY